MKMLNPGRGVKEKLGHGFYPGIFRGKQDPPDSLSHLCPAGFTGEQEGSLNPFQVRCQEANLGGFAAPFDSFEGYEKAQISPIYRLKNYTLNGLFWQMRLKYLDKIRAYYNFGRERMGVRGELLNSAHCLGRPMRRER